MTTPPHTDQGDLETLLRADGPGPATPLKADAANALVEAALCRFELEGGFLHSAAIPASKPASKLPLWWMLSAALVISGSAAAMVWVPWQAESSSPPKAPAVPATRVMEAAQPKQPTLQPEEAPALPVEATVPEAVAPTAPATPSPRPADLLRSANQLRGAGQYRAAERKYLQVAAQSPRSASGYSARVAAANLRGERLGDPRGALQLYRDALQQQPSGALTPEIREGMAQVYRKLGDTAAEGRALRALLTAQPEGPAAERARRRLQALDDAP